MVADHLLMTQHVLDGFYVFASDPLKAGVSIILLLSAIALFALVRRETNLARKSLLMFLNLLALAFPVALLAFSLSCPVAGVGCAVTVTQSALLSFPTALLLAAVFYYLLVPRMQTMNCTSLGQAHPLSRFAAREAARLGLQAPRVMVADSHSLAAYCVYSPRPSVVVSVGVLELLGRKEKEAIVLHELSHLSRRSPAFKAAASIYNLLLPLRTPFFNDFSLEERKADGYAASRQGTRKFVNSAKKAFSQGAE